MGSADADCWYLYTLNRDNYVKGDREADQTLEILMTDLDPDVMSIFTRDFCSSATEATQKSGIDKLITNMVIDDFLFEPCGYSMNGVSKSVSLAFYSHRGRSCDNDRSNIKCKSVITEME